jgi:hypothetical protein
MTTGMTMGIVLVACFAARIGPGPAANDDRDFEIDQFGGQNWETFVIAFGPAVFESDSCPVDIIEFTQALDECFDQRIGRRASSQNPDMRNSRGLLR